MNQPPNRMPCEAVAGKPLFFLGGPFQHALAPAFADKFLNTTAVPNWNTIVGGAVGPYERFTQDLSGGDSCESHHCNPDGAPCSTWLRPFPTNTFAHVDVDTVNFAVTRKTGFKNVMARRFWSGVFGFLESRGALGDYDTAQCCGDGSFKKWRGYTNSIPNTKYTAISISAEDKIVDFDSGGSSTIVRDNTASITQAIDTTSGLPANSDLLVSPNRDDNTAIAMLSMFATINALIDQMTVNKTELPGQTFACTDNSITITDSFGDVRETVVWDLSAGTFTRNTYQRISGSYLPIETETLTLSDSSFNYSDHVNGYGDDGSGPFVNVTNDITVSSTLGGANTSASIYADIKNLLSKWDLSDDKQYPWRSDLKVSAAPLVSRDELFTTSFNTAFFTVKDYSSPIVDDGGLSIGDPSWHDHSAVLMNQDSSTGTTIISMGGHASNGDIFDGTGVANPFAWTTVGGYSMAGTLPPGVSFDSATGQLSGTCSADCTWGITVTVTAAAPAATGNILGAPLAAGYENYFDFGYRDYLGCCFHPPESPGTQTWSWYQHGWGMNVGTFNVDSGCQLPLNATQWTNYFQSINKPQGAFLFYNEPSQNFFGAGCVSSSGGSGTLDGDALWGGKYAECLEQWNSQNFARPAGDDKFAFDENHVFCAVNATGSGEGSTWTITNALDGTPPPDGTDFSGIWGGPSVGGFYNVSGYSDGTLTLGAKAYDVPTHWASKSNNDGALCFGKLRYPASPALLGRIGITADMAGTIFTFATPQPAFGMDSTTHQEQVDLLADDMTVLASNVTATRTSDTAFIVTGAQPMAKWVVIHGAPAWYINDNKPKGDYALLEWLSDFRTFGEYNRLAGILDCSGTQVAQPTANAGSGPVSVDTQFASFTQTPGCLPFAPCAPKVVCISPNGEVFPNGVTYPFPEGFVCDEQYGSKWWAFVQSTMSDLLWQTPHRPCNIETCALWKMDDLTCHEDSPANGITFACPGDDGYVDGESQPPVYYFAAPPLVEARLTVPCHYGAAQDECAPTLPLGVQIGWLSPVLYSTGDVALPPSPPGALADRGEPAGASTSWNVHSLVCTYGPGCRFGYQEPGC